MNKVIVSAEVLKGLNAVRQSGRTNMCGSRAVVRLARKMGYHSTARWIENFPNAYIQGIFAGFEAEEVLKCPTSLGS